MFNSDKPIENASDDLLKRTIFSKELAKAILSYTAIDNFTIGLCGEWGCGKTSIINMVIQEINHLTTELGAHQKPIVVQFNPWNYADRNQLLTQFFQTILAKLDKSDNNVKLKNIGTALEKYSSALEYTAYIPVVGKYLSSLASVFSGAGEQIQEVADARENVSAKKEFVINTLKEQSQKIIVVIDDIDRLNNEQICLIFQLVNSLAGFPNMIYLLSFDKEVVVRALSKEQNCDGEEYLEKIIQVPFEVPIIQNADVHKVFFNELNKLFNEIPCKNFDEAYWNKVFNHCVRYFLNSIRDVNRIINVYRFNYELMHEETNCIDLMAITTLQVRAPKIAAWIYQNKTKLTGSVQSLSGATGEERKKAREQYIEEFKSVHRINPTIMLDIIQTLFPKFCWLTDGNNYSIDSNDELRHKQKMAHSERFRYYFTLSLEDIVISREDILSTINNMDKITLREYLNGLMRESRLTEYLLELRSYIPDIPKERHPLFFYELLYLLSISKKSNLQYNLAPMPTYECENCIYAILTYMEEQPRFDILSSSISHAEFNTLSFITDIIFSIERSWGKIGDSIDDSFRYVSRDQLVKLEKLWLDRVNVISKSHNLFDINDNYYISKFWKFLDPEEFSRYTKEQLSIPSNVPKYLSNKVESWVGGGTKGYNFNENSFSDFISKEEAYNKICELRGTTNFSDLALEYKRVCLAFYLWYNLNKEDYHNVLSKENVDEHIPEWENVRENSE